MKVDDAKRILCLDGGGSKGVYTLGVLSELEKAVGYKLSDFFHLIYGTSTGSIIAAMLALGLSVEEIKISYFKLVPQIMGQKNKKGKSRKLHTLGNEIFGSKMFDAFKTDVGIISMNYLDQTPLIFKSKISQAHGTKSSFEPGFGVTILSAIEASCAAFPIFEKKELKTKNKGTLTAIDGGFIANNPTLFALIDAKQALELKNNQIKLLSIGVGNYIEKSFSKTAEFISWFEMAQFVSRVIVASSNTTETITNLLFPDIPIVRINDTFNKPEHGTNMVEKKISKLDEMYRLGIQSYAKHEKLILKSILGS